MYSANDRAPPFPYCALCKAPVREMQWWDDFVTECRCVKVECHGQSETTRIPYRLFMDRRLDIKPGVAFSSVQAIEK
jgi:hypothetical protein